MFFIREYLFDQVFRDDEMFSADFNFNIIKFFVHGDSRITR